MAQAVDWELDSAPAVSDQPPSPLLAALEPARAVADRRAVAGGDAERLEDGAGAVGLALAAVDEAPAAVAVLTSTAARRPPCRRCRPPTPADALGEDREGGQVDLPLEGAVLVLALAELGDQVGPAEVAGVELGPSSARIVRSMSPVDSISLL